MSLIFSSPPNDAVAELEKTLNIISGLAADPLNSPIFPREYASQRSRNAAYPLFFLSLQALAAGTAFAKSEPVGWRFSITFEPNIIACADVNFDLQSSQYHFSEIYSTSRCNDNLSLLQQLSTDSALSGFEYDTRILTIPSLHSEFVWFAAVHSAPDILSPLLPIPDFLPRDQRRYSSDELMPLLQAVASRKLQISTVKSS